MLAGSCRSVWGYNEVLPVNWWVAARCSAVGVGGAPVCRCFRGVLKMLKFAVFLLCFYAVTQVKMQQNAKVVQKTMKFNSVNEKTLKILFFLLFFVCFLSFFVKVNNFDCILVCFGSVLRDACDN